MIDGKVEAVDASAITEAHRNISPSRLLFVVALSWLWSMLWVRFHGIDLSIAWGGITVCAVGSYGGWLVYHRASGRNDGHLLVLYGMMPIIGAKRDDVSDLLFLGFVLRSRWMTGVMMTVMVSFMLMSRCVAAGFRRRSCSPAPTVWDAELDQPLAAKGPH